MKRLLIGWLVLTAAPLAHAGPNLLANGGFDSTAGAVYYDGFDPTLADDVPGWLMSLGAADGSYVLVSPEANPAAGGFDLDMGDGPSGGTIETAAASRPAVTPSTAYIASMTSDNYFGPAGAAFFVDWYDVGGVLISSAGGPVADLNGPLVYAPYTQGYTINAVAPATAATAGVRFTSGNAGYAGLAADNFSLAVVPEPSYLALIAFAAAGWTAARRRRSNP